MSSSMFEQYQKYYESLINQHKSTCKMENQHNTQLHQTQQQRPVRAQQPAQQQPLRQLQPETYMFNSWPQQQQLGPMYQPAHQAFNFQPSCFFCGPGGYQHPISPMHPYQLCCCPQCCLKQNVIPPSPQEFGSVIMPSQIDLALCRGPEAEMAPANVYPPQQPPEQQQQQQGFCYPSGTGGIPCSPCTGCKFKPVDIQQPKQQQQLQQQQLQQQQQQLQQQQLQQQQLQQQQLQQQQLQPQQVQQQQLQPQQVQQQQLQPQQVQQQQLQPQQVQQQQQVQQNCPAGQNCESGWVPPFDGKDESTGDKKERLPLGVEQPFVVGPTTYQYFFG